MLIFISFCFIVLVQVFFYLVIFSRFSFSRSIVPYSKFQPVSVIICAKNESENLSRFLPKIANQKYPVFEMVLIDDGSEDQTLQKMLDFKKQFTSDLLQIQIISIDKKASYGKKAALNLGIKASKYESLLLTDADCEPVSDQWIKEMTAHLANDKTIVLGYGAYRKIEKSFLNKMIRFETLMTAIQYFSFTKIGIPYMGVGRNIAYTIHEFKKVNGFENHLNIESGDDDLLVNQMAKSKNTTICITKNSFTLSEPKLKIKDWIQQKRRHITTASHYKSIHKILLGLFYLSQIFFWSLGLFLLFSENYQEIASLLMIVRFFIWYMIIYKSAYRLNEKDLIRWAPLYEISIIFMQFYIFLQNIIGPPKHW